MAEGVRIRRDVLEGMLAEARRDPGLECCGLLAGRGGVITRLLPAANARASAAAFEIAPRDLFAMFRAMRAEGLEHLGIYHSHPAGDNAPSARDVELAFYPQAAYFIVSPRPEGARAVRAFRIRGGVVTEMELVVEP